MNDSALLKTFREIGKKRGNDNEGRFFKLFEYGKVPPDFPSWFHGIRPGTQEEDYRGIDAVAFTDVGKIFLQIKSSKSGARKFQKQQEKYRLRVWISIVIVRNIDGDSDILKKTRSVLSKARFNILERRNRANF